MKKMGLLLMMTLVLLLATACVDYGDAHQPTVHIHSYQQESRAATCTDGGFDVFTCSCGESYEEQVAEPLGHAWDAWRVTERPTTTTQGVRTHSCLTCGYREINPVTMLQEEGGIVLVYWAETVVQGKTVSLTILGKAWMEYTLLVYDAAGAPISLPGTAAYADGEGYLTWEIDRDWKPGVYEMMIIGGGKTASVSFTVVKTEE